MIDRGKNRRCGLLAAFLGATLGGSVLLAGGCASCASCGWAETAPTIAPSRPGEGFVFGGSRESPSADPDAVAILSN